MIEVALAPSDVAAADVAGRAVAVIPAFPDLRITVAHHGGGNA